MNTLWLRVVDAELNTIREADARAVAEGEQAIQLRREDDHWVGEGRSGTRVTIHASAKGYESERHALVLRDAVTQAVVALRRPDQLAYTQGDERLAFTPVHDAFLLHVQGNGAADDLRGVMRKLQLKYGPASPQAMPATDDLFVRVEGDLEKAPQLLEALAGRQLRGEISRVIQHGERPPVGLTNELVVRFRDDVRRPEAERLAASAGLEITREVRHAGNAFVLTRGDLPSYDLLRVADALAESGRVVYVEPNLTFVPELDQYIPNDPLFNQVPHLGLISADDAWDLMDDVSIPLRGGSPAITIGVIDPQGVAPDHPELTATLTDGTGKLVSSMNFGASPIAAQTVAGLSGDHGTQCAASATAAFDDSRGMPGVAPNCHLIGARIATSNAVRMADIYMWVGGFMNGSTDPGFPAAPPARPADVISSSWGVTGLALSNTIRDCFDFLTTYSRGGRGCVLCFSLGNSGYGDYTNPTGGRFRAWPNYEKTLGVGSSINVSPTNPVPTSVHADPNGNTNNIATAVDTRSLFSPFGATALRKPDLVSPSHTAYNGGLIDPILSAVRVGTGTVDGCPDPATCNDYAVSFGGTSHSTPSVAGGVAMILSAHPGLNWVQVRDILRETCARIDAAQANAIGQWQDLDGDGLIDYSRWYGAGRLDVAAAVGRALDGALLLSDVYVRENLVDTGTVPSASPWWASPDIWVRQDAGTPIPTLAWTDSAPHQNARRGQDNAVFCRVRNRGGAPATAVYVRAMLTHFAGLEFTYPADFQPSANVGAAIPNPLVPGTYLIGEERIDNLGPGANQIVKFVWEQALIPPETVVVGGATVTWHPCLLIEASPHDGPTPIGGLAVPVQGNNNLAQRNIAIVDADDAAADTFVAMIAGTRERAGVASLILDATMLRGATGIRLHLADAELMRRFADSARDAANEHRIPPATGPQRERCFVVIEERTRLRIPCGPCDTIIVAAPGTRIMTDACRPAPPLRVSMLKHQDLDALELAGLSGRIEIPLGLQGGKYVPLLVAITGPAEGDLAISQRRGDGQLSAGYAIRRGSA